MTVGGTPLTAAEAHALVDVPTSDLLQPAWELARAGHGTLVTYSPKVFIPLTKLCRDVCHYCTFAQAPRNVHRAYLTPDEVLEIARAGAAAGCHEALFTLGDKPELRYRAAGDQLRELGHPTTIAYLTAMARLVLEETGLLPHANPGVATLAELRALRDVSASQGMMLETVADRLSERGGPHFGSPDKRPVLRLATLEAAGEATVPYTTGLLIGIGETRAERIDTLLAIRAAHERHGHVGEVIVQNFRAKADTRMADAPEPSFDDLRWTVAAARLVLGPAMTVQVPPNLSDDGYADLLDAGIDDWGGVSPVTVDHVNPEAPWPAIAALEAATAAKGLTLVPRLPIYPRHVADLDHWCAPRVAAAVRARADALGLARPLGWAAGDPSGLPPATPVRRAGRRPVDPAVAAALDDARRGIELDEDAVAALFGARGEDLGHVYAAADRLRREVCGDEVTYVVNRNINYTNVCYFRCGFCAFSKGKLAADLRGTPYVVAVDEITRRVREAWDRGAVEVCLQGGIHPAFTGDFYLEVLEAVKAAVPDIHVHAFSALEVWQGAATLDLPLEDYLTRLREAGLSSLPGTAAEVLDDDVRAVLCPDKVSTAQWLEVHDAAHRVGLRSTTTVMYGHVDGPRNWARHLLALRDQQRRTGGFTEFVPLPFVHMEAPIALQGRARPGPTFDEAVLMHAVGRLALHPHITNVQASWVKLGPVGAAAALRAGVNDLGGTLMNESISRAAGAAHGQEFAPEQMEALIRSLGRTPRQRTTFYGSPSPDRTAASYGAPPLDPPVNRSVSDAKLRRPSRLVRPGLVGVGS